MQSRIQFAVISSLQLRRKAAVSAFSLVELMIVVAVLGILSASAIPGFLNSRYRAEAGAEIAEAISLAKECATANASVIPVTVGGQTCNSSGSNTFSATWARSVSGLVCINSTISGTTATVTVTSTGNISCS